MEERGAVLALAVFACVLCACDTAVPTFTRDRLVLHYYKFNTTCTKAEQYVQIIVKNAWNADRSITAKLLRLLYSDCFVTGCDASILLDGNDSEQTALQNQGLGAFDLIDQIKKFLEAKCPGVVSCADILNLATKEAAALAGAPAYPVYTGRMDGMSSTAKSVDLPLPSITWEQGLAYFSSRGLSILDFTTLLGAHTVGTTHCRYILDRLYNFKGTGKADPSMKPALITQLKKQCSQKNKTITDPTVYLNSNSGKAYKFTNSYYSRVLNKQAILEIDQQLLFGNDTSEIAQEFSDGFEDFRLAFALSISKMGSIGVLTGKQGEIRQNCRFINKKKPKP